MFIVAVFQIEVSGDVGPPFGGKFYSISNQGFSFPHTSPWKATKKKIKKIFRESTLGHKFLRACMLEEYNTITSMYVQNSMFIGSVFLVEVSMLSYPLSEWDKKNNAFCKVKFGH